MDSNSKEKIENHPFHFSTVESVNEFKRLMYQGLICPYCRCQTELIDSKEIYGTSYGWIYICRPCDAYVGCHKNGDPEEVPIALGRLANAELREWKKKAHSLFDRIWKMKYLNENQLTRKEAYAWLSRMLGIEEKYCHIGMFDVAQCRALCMLFDKKIYPTLENPEEIVDPDFVLFYDPLAPESPWTEEDLAGDLW